MDQTNTIAPESSDLDTKRRAERKLTLKVDVIRTLSDSEMGQVAGAGIWPSLSTSVRTPSTSVL
ncbi:MAG TPA: hypothetical protein VLW55_07595 [Burkholderiaceae bacterium]|nr:hypothetical protein [Burkholderiaceae bacterium]